MSYIIILQRVSISVLLPCDKTWCLLAYLASDLSHYLFRSDWQLHLLVGYSHQTHV